MGAYKNDATGVDNAGAAYVFDVTLTEANHTAKLVASAPAEDADFGRNVAIHGDLIVVGADGEAAAYVFARNQGGASAWGEIKRLDGALVPGAAADFGHRVALHGGVALVAGDTSVYAFSRHAGGTDAFGLVRTLQPTNGTVDTFGRAVALSGTAAVVGAYDYNQVYRFDSVQCAPLGATNCSAAEGCEFRDSACHPCAAGSFGTGSCDPVPPGAWSPAGAAAPRPVAECPAGSACGGGVRTICAPGSYSPRAGKGGSCKSCGPDKYVDYSGALACLACPKGQVSAAPATSCRASPAPRMVASFGVTGVLLVVSLVALL